MLSIIKLIVKIVWFIKKDRKRSGVLLLMCLLISVISLEGFTYNSRPKKIPAGFEIIKNASKYNNKAKKVSIFYLR